MEREGDKDLDAELEESGWKCDGCGLYLPTEKVTVVQNFFCFVIFDCFSRYWVWLLAAQEMGLYWSNISLCLEEIEISS